MQKKIVSVGNMDMDINRLFFSFSLTPLFTLYPVLSYLSGEISIQIGRCILEEGVYAVCGLNTSKLLASLHHPPF